jgi:glycosyltransferase involved in cell wall biosynthesis
MNTNDIRVHVISSMFNGAGFLGDFLRSLQAQIHTNWQLWLRNDGSTDDGVSMAMAASHSDPRIHLIDDGQPRLGAARSFGIALQHVPLDAAYVMCGDVDDVWLPDKIDRMLAFIRECETRHSARTPTLAHSDLTVVDERLGVIAPSYWQYMGISPEPATLRRLVVTNPAAGSAIIFNNALRDALRVGVPVEALYQDWWFALVAVAIGRVHAMRHSTALYRQHASNSVGASAAAPLGGGALLRRIGHAWSRRDVFQTDLARTAAQAGALLDRYGTVLRPDERAFLAAYSALPSQAFYRRKIGLLRYRVLPEYGTVKTLGVLLRG